MSDTIAVVAICLVVAVGLASCSYATVESGKASYDYKLKCLDRGGYIEWTGNCVVPPKPEART